MTTTPPRLRASLGAAVLALAALTGCGGGPAASATDTADATPQAAGSRVAAPASPDPAQREVTEKIRRLEKARGVRIGAYAVATGDGRAVGHRTGETFPFASTFKAMVCAAVLRKARDSDPGLLDRVIRYTEDDLVSYSPVTEKHVGEGMKVSDLCHAAITESDNTAANLTLRQIGGPAGLTAFLRSLGDRVSRSDRWEPELNEWKPGERRDTTSPRATAEDLRALTVGDALAPADRERMIGWMRATVTGDARIRAGLPDDWTVGDKTGTGGTYGSANDIAIAHPPSGAPLVITVFTTKRDPDGEPDEAAIARTAAILAGALR